MNEPSHECFLFLRFFPPLDSSLSSRSIDRGARREPKDRSTHLGGRPRASPPGSELERVSQLLRALATTEEIEGGASLHVVLHGPEGDEIPLPANWEQTVLRILQEVSAGRHVEVRVEATDEVGTAKLAELLGVSRPTAAALVDGGALPSRVTPGGHRRVRLADVRAYLRQRERQRASLAELVSHGEETGLPFETPPELRGAPDGGEAQDRERLAGSTRVGPVAAGTGWVGAAGSG